MPQNTLFERPLDELLAEPKNQARRESRKPAVTKSRDRSPVELLALARAQKRNLLVLIASVLFPILASAAIFALWLKKPDELLFQLVCVVCTGIAIVLIVWQFIEMVKFARRGFETGGVALMVFLWLFLWPVGILLASFLTHLQANNIFRRNGICTSYLGASSAALREIDPALRHETQLPRLGW